MRITIRYFASAREAAGRAEDTLDAPAGTTAGEAFRLLCGLHPALAPLEASLRFAVDEDFVSTTHVLAANATLALIPPVGGG